MTPEQKTAAETPEESSAAPSAAAEQDFQAVDTAPDVAPHLARIRSFVRRSGRMTLSQQRAWEDYRHNYLLNLPSDGSETGVAAGFAQHPDTLFTSPAPLTVEIGSGQGHAILHAAETNPDRNFLAIEVFEAGLARTVLSAEQLGLQNLKLAAANAPEVLEHFLPASTVDEIWVFFPDPWHKTRHHKRRLINPPFLQIAATALRQGGLLRLATDWEEYALHMREVLDADAAFAREFTGDWAPRFAGRIETAFERKGKAKGRAIRDLTYRRI